MEQLFPALIIVLLGSINADYQCVCNYDLSAKVYDAVTSGNVVDTMNEFDCKPLKTKVSGSSWASIVLSDHSTAFVQTGGMVLVQTCPGDPPTAATTTPTPPPTTRKTTTPTPTTTTPKPTPAPNPELVFKITAHIGGPDVFRAWTYGEGTTSDVGCRNVHINGCSKHYRHPSLDNWQGIKKHLIKYALYKNEQEVASIWFDGTGSSITNWFSHNRVVNSTWTDLRTSFGYIFSIDGAAWSRRFSAQNGYDGCTKDYGWTVVITDHKHTNCVYDRFNITTPYILYARGHSKAHYPEGFEFADAAAVFIDGLRA